MGLGLRALGRLAGSDVVDRLGVRKPAERVLYRATRDGFKAAGAATRTFKSVNGGRKATRLPSTTGSGLFDLTPSDEQQMLQESFKAFGAEQLRPNALRADTDAKTPDEILTSAGELGLTMLGVPEALGGAVSERSSVTAVLAAEALAHGDMGLAVALLAPAGVASRARAVGRRRPAGDLPAGVRRGRDARRPPRSRSRSRARCSTRSSCRRPRRRERDDFVLDGVKSLVPLAESADLLIVAARLEGHGPVLFLVETKQRRRAREGCAGHGRAGRRHRRRAARGRAPAGERAAGGRRPGRLRGRRPPRAPRVVRACVRHRPRGARLRDPARQRARRVRRADLEPPVGRVHRLRHRPRAGGHAARDAAGRRSPRRRQGRARGRSRSPARCAARRARGSAPTACSCSAATAT